MLRPIGTTFEIVYPPDSAATDFERGTYPRVMTYRVVAHVDIWPDGKAEEIRAIGQRYDKSSIGEQRCLNFTSS